MFWNKKQQQHTPSLSEQIDELERMEAEREAWAQRQYEAAEQRKQMLIQLGDNIAEQLITNQHLDPSHAYYHHAEDVVVGGITFEVSAYLSYDKGYGFSATPVTPGKYGRGGHAAVLISRNGADAHVFINEDVAPQAVLISVISTIGTWR